MEIKKHRKKFAAYSKHAISYYVILENNMFYLKGSNFTAGSGTEKENKNVLSSGKQFSAFQSVTARKGIIFLSVLNFTYMITDLYKVNSRD